MPDMITKQQHAQIQILRKQGLSFRAISKEVGCSHDSAHKWDGKPYPDMKAALPTDDADLVFSIISKAKRKWKIEELSDKLDIGMGRIRAAVGELKSSGRNISQVDSSVELLQTVPVADPLRIDVAKFKGKRIRFGLTSDNHLGSKYARNDVLEALFDIWQDAGITDVYQCGNMIDGDARFNRFDLLVHGMEAQANYFAEVWPARKGMHTHFITGDDHEGWYVQREGVVIGDYLEHVAQKHGRKDLHYLGHMEHDIIFKAKRGSSTMRLIHGGGGSAYAISYKPQSIINSYQGGEKPNILLIGHYHKADFNYWREVLNVQAGCTEDQTPFLRKLNIQAHVGGWTIEFEIDDDGIVHDFTTKWHPFYDRKFYENKQWAYKWDTKRLKRAG